MANTIVKGKIHDHNRTEKYDDEGIKFINYWIKVDGKKYTVDMSAKNSIYFENQLEVVLYVDENNLAIAGICPKIDYKWGNTGPLKSEVKESDRYELVQGLVQEKRTENFSVNKGTTGVDSFTSSSSSVTTYTIVLPEKNFRVVDLIGKHIKPNTEIAALLENNVAYIIKDKTNNKVYGKPRKDYLIGLFLLIAFNATIIGTVIAGKKAIFINFTTLVVIGNIFFGIAFLISFVSFLSTVKTLKIFNQMLDESK